MENIAIIDMGSNSIRFVVIQLYDNRSHALQMQQKESIRLGEGMAATNRLSPEGVERAMCCLHAYRHMMEVMGVTKCIAVATAAVRNADDGQEFIERIRQETGIAVEVISGEKEAYYGYLGVINTIDMRDYIQFDLGGASVEISLVRNRQIEKSVSVPIGAVTVTDRFGLQGNVPERLLQKCQQYVMKKLREMVPWVKNQALPVIGVGGTARAMAKIDQQLTDYQLQRIHNYVLPMTRFRKIYEEITEKGYRARKKIPGLSGDRVDLIVAGAAIIKSLLDFNGGDVLVVSGCGLRDGVFYEYYGQRFGIPPIIDDILGFSTRNYLGTLQDVNLPHVEQVQATALDLFDLLRPLHGYGSRARQLLGVAARLHDTGKAINYDDHARHSAFIIGHAPLYGMSQLEQIITAFIAGFHHGIRKKTLRAYRYGMMPSKSQWAMIRKLAILLALAEAADITYEQIVASVDAEMEEGEVLLTVNAQPGAGGHAAVMEMESFAKQFKKEFGYALRIQWKS